MGHVVSVRPELPGDRAAVHEVVRQAFPEEPVVADLVDALRAHPAGRDRLSFVAESDGRVIGHVMFTWSLVDAPSRLVDVLVLSPLAVVPDRQGQSVGDALVRHGLAAVASRTPLVFLEGPPRYYARFGFEPAGAHGFRKPSLRIPDAAFQVVRTPSHEPWMTGTLVYAEPFWTLDCVGLRHPQS